MHVNYPHGLPKNQCSCAAARQRSRRCYDERRRGDMQPMAMFPLSPPLRDDVDQAPVTQQVEAAPGEIELDAVVRAQASAPQVVERLTTLEDCLWAAVDAL